MSECMENFHCLPEFDFGTEPKPKKDIRIELQELYPDVDLLFMTERVFDNAIIGVAERIGDNPSVAYDYGKVISANIEMGMTYEEAVEYFEFNQIGAYVGEQTPIFITKP